MSGARKKLLEGDALAGGVWVYGDDACVGLYEKIAARSSRKELEPLPRPCASVVGGKWKLGWSWSWSGSGGVEE